MPISEDARSAEAIRRKLRSIAAVLLDPAATEHERANAETLKMRLEKQLRQEASPEGSFIRTGTGSRRAFDPNEVWLVLLRVGGQHSGHGQDESQSQPQ